MNWTGGSLSRSRKQNTNLSVIQKKHFAKARGALLNGRPPPPRIDVSSFQAPARDGKVPDSIPVASHPHREHQGSQLTLDHYENVRPVVRQLQSLRPRRTSRACVRSRHPLSQRPLRSPDSAGRRSAQARNTSSHGSARSQNHDPETPRSVARTSTVDSPVDELEAKRRGLLGTSDWMGLEKMKPVKIKFPDAEDRDLIGKRRRVERNHPAVTSLQHPNRRSVVNTYEKLNMLRASSRLLSSPENISIHIGSSDRGSSVRRRDNDGSIKRGSQHGSTPQEMLFEDQESARTRIRKSASTLSGSHQPLAVSEEMLFDREWSETAPVLGTASTAHPIDVEGNPSYRIGLHTAVKSSRSQKAHTLSSNSDSDDLYGSQYAKEDLTDNPQELLIAPDRIHANHASPGVAQGPFESAQSIALDSDEKLDIDEMPGLPPLQTAAAWSEYYDPQQPNFKPSRRPLSIDQNASNRGTNQESTVRKNEDYEQPFARATAQELANLIRAAGAPQELSYAVQTTEDLNAEHPPIISEVLNNDAMEPLVVEQQQQRVREPLRQAQTRQTPPQPDPQSPTEAATTNLLAKPSAPAPPSPPPKPTENGKKAPADPTPEEDELLWRTFVFGTQYPDDDWTFSNPINRPIFPAKPSSSSSLLPIHEQRHEEGSPITINDQTQPSLLVEASSSSANPLLSNIHSFASSSPLHLQPRRPSTTAQGVSPSLQPSTDPRDENGSSHSPSHTQLSLQAHASTSTSVDELARSPTHPLAPPVIFTRPRR
ncbi:MAG: hypothetical protein Q9181_002553, partial [Wetmoreana brouardii]